MGEPLLVPDAQVDERHSRAIDQLTGLTHRAVLSVPLVSKSDVFGVLQLVDTVAGRFELPDLRMAEIPCLHCRHRDRERTALPRR